MVFNSDRYAGSVFGERSGPVGDSGLEVLRIGLGNLVDDTRGEIQKCDDAVVFERYVSFAADERYVSVKRVGYRIFFKIRHDDVENEFRLIVFDAGHYFIESDTYVIGNYFCIFYLYTVFAGLVFDQSVGGFGRDRTAGGVVYRYGVLYRAVGLIARQCALPEVIRSVHVVNVERVAPGVAVDLDPLVGVAGVADVLRSRAGTVIVFAVTVSVDLNSAVSRKRVRLNGSARKRVAVIRHRISRERRDCRSSLLCEVAGQSGVRRERAVVLVVFRMRRIVSVIVKERAAREHQIARRCAASVGRTVESVFVGPFGARVDRCQRFAVLEHVIRLRRMFRCRGIETGNIDALQFLAVVEHLTPVSAAVCGIRSAENEALHIAGRHIRAVVEHLIRVHGVRRVGSGEVYRLQTGAFQEHTVESCAIAAPILNECGEVSA